MSSRSPETFLSAALRHVTDAHHLLSFSPDQSWHLAGFGPECARKACLERGWFDRALGHDLSELADLVLAYALALDPRAHKYPIMAFHKHFPLLAGWHPETRYEATGTRTKADAMKLVNAASELTYLLAAELWMDNVVRTVQ